MPGHILIVDPIITSRVVLKAQLVSDYYSVDAVSDLTSARALSVKSPPDAIILRYEVEESCGFSTCKLIKRDPFLSHIPIVLTCQMIEDLFWNTAFNIGVEEVVPLVPDTDLLRCRLGLLIRQKEIIDEVRTRQRTYSDMGFAEDCLTYPPQFTPSLTIGCAEASKLVKLECAHEIKELLGNDFPNLIWSSNFDKKTDVLLIDEAQVGQRAALQRLCDLHQMPSGNPPKILYLGSGGKKTGGARALELGADDFLLRPFTPAELAIRLRRLGWLHQLEQQAEKQVSDRLRQALCDPLTGLHNRRYALHYLDRLLSESRAERRSIAVMMLDLDNFKAVNDSLGHQVGDLVICETAGRLSDKLRSADLIARIGGEEFLVVLTDTSERQASRIAERMRLQIAARPFRINGTQSKLEISISIGVAFATVGFQTSAEIIQRADEALYQSKNRGRNLVTFLPAAA
ncbi:MAG: diguanylate cyclase [Rhodobacteraceae bacterium]|nr:diguanylate cyclase [Paracoccaceae bacterium]